MSGRTYALPPSIIALVVLLALGWGSNWPVPKPNEPTYSQRLETLRTHLPAFQELSPSDQAQILGGTALALWTPAGA